MITEVRSGSKCQRLYCVAASDKEFHCYFWKNFWCVFEKFLFYLDTLVFITSCHIRMQLTEYQWFIKAVQRSTKIQDNACSSIWLTTNNKYCLIIMNQQIVFRNLKTAWDFTKNRNIFCLFCRFSWKIGFFMSLEIAIINYISIQCNYLTYLLCEENT